MTTATQVGNHVAALARMERARYAVAVKKITTNKRTKLCGLHSLGNVEIRQKNGSAYYVGMAHCARQWSCPDCAARIGFKRAKDVAHILKTHHTNGGMALLFTFTLKHGQGESLSHLLDTLRFSFKSLMGNSIWRQWKTANNVIGTIKSVEITPGGTSGSAHPHIHLMVLLDRSDFSNYDYHLSWDRIGEAWSNIVNRNSPGNRPPWNIGVRIDYVNLDDADYYANYLMKSVEQRAADELVRSDKKSSSSYWLVAMAAASGDQRSFAMWQEYELATHGVHKLAYSRGLRSRFGLIEKDKTDEELASEEDQNGELIAELDDEEAKVVRNVHPILKILLLEYAEVKGVDGIQWLLERFKLALVPLHDYEPAVRWLDINRIRSPYHEQTRILDYA